MAEGGAPAGFEDVVAALNPIADDQPDVPAHWNVTFAVDDADATAEKAAELGGRVVAPPVDAPWVRMTVIADPQGATFIASKFVPENRDIGREAGSAARAGEAQWTPPPPGGGRGVADVNALTARRWPEPLPRGLHCALECDPGRAGETGRQRDGSTHGR